MAVLQRTYHCNDTVQNAAFFLGSLGQTKAVLKIDIMVWFLHAFLTDVKLYSQSNVFLNKLEITSQLESFNHFSSFFKFKSQEFSNASLYCYRQNQPYFIFNLETMLFPWASINEFYCSYIVIIRTTQSNVLLNKLEITSQLKSFNHFSSFFEFKS